jgi:hypothetical protein
MFYVGYFKLNGLNKEQHVQVSDTTMLKKEQMFVPKISLLSFSPFAS